MITVKYYKRDLSRTLKHFRSINIPVKVQIVSVHFQSFSCNVSKSNDGTVVIDTSIFISPFDWKLTGIPIL